jgi:hypothetical protein
MRLMLGNVGNPSLLVSVDDNYDPQNFKFRVINGAWDGVFYKGHITVLGIPGGGDYSDLDITEILTDNQDRLRCNFTIFDDYNTVFINFHDENYVAPQYKQVKFDDMDDDIPF